MGDQEFIFELFSTKRIYELIHRHSLSCEIDLREIDIEWREDDFVPRIAHIWQSEKYHSREEKHDNQDHDNKYFWSTDEQSFPIHTMSI
jgi:hypothetical protein